SLTLPTMKNPPRPSVKRIFLVMTVCAVIWIILGSREEDGAFKSIKSGIAGISPAGHGVSLSDPFVSKHPQYEIQHDVSLSGHCTRHKFKEHLIYMFITEWTDTQYHENLKISDEIVFVSEDVEQCPKTQCCMVVKTGFTYETLDQKVELLLKIASNMFDGFVTLTKIDDDAYVDYGFFLSLRENLTENSYFGHFGPGHCLSSTFDLAKGPFYIIGRRLIHCLLSDFRTCGDGHEDKAVALSIYRNCKGYQRQDFKDYMNKHIFHKTYARKNKVLHLSNTNPNTASMMFAYKWSLPALVAPVLSEQDA
ncbi:hypothetical protein BGX30_002195, partial [Mortierella sp. GBA39]